MQKTILISGTYPILDEKLNDLLGRSYDIAALEQPFPVNARKFGWVEAVVVYVPYCGEPEDAAAAQRYTEARAAADWATKEGLRCALLIDAEAHSFLPCFPSACTVFILPELYGLDRRGRPEGWLGEAMRRLEAGERMDADDVVPAYFVLADEAAARIHAALRERADGTIRLIQTRRTIRFRFLGKLAALYDFDRTNIYPCDAHLPHYVPLLGGGNSISIAARPTQDLQRSTGSSTASSGWSISASRTSCSAGGPWRSSAGCWAQRWPRRCRARLPAGPTA